MDFLSFYFYIYLAIVVILYYVFPLRFRWVVLLSGSMAYFFMITSYLREWMIFLGIILVSWILGILQDRLAQADVVGEETDNRYNNPAGVPLPRKVILIISVAVELLPLLLSKYSAGLYALESFLKVDHAGVVVTVGMSFFTMQIVAYQVDIYRGKIRAQRNLLKYALFVSWFPQIIQGPIPRYDQLEPQLIEGHRFDDKGFVKGFMLIIWGFFLKLMIADKAGVVVDEIFDNYEIYQGCYVLVAGILYSIQLYADFLACVTLAQGISELFGIHLADNFQRPYLAVSIKDFWSRWHISLSTWLRDYVYIPLGGNRKGAIRKYINLVVTFTVSGLWHGSGWKYVIWGMMHAGYQILGSWTVKLRDRLYCCVGLPEGRRGRIWIKRAGTFMLAMMAWIVFRADTLRKGLYMLLNMFTTYNPWVLMDDSLLNLGLDGKEWVILMMSVAILIYVGIKQESGVKLRDVILRQPLFMRWSLYLMAIVIIMMFGTYGYGYNASDFIYGNF